MKNLKQKLMIPITAGIIAASGLVGCATTNTNYTQPTDVPKPVTTNLAKNLKGYPTETIEHETDYFHVNSKTAYVVNENPQAFILPNGSQLLTDAIIKVNESEFTETYGKDSERIVDYAPIDKYLAVAPVDTAKKNGKTVLYLVKAEQDSNEKLPLPPKYNIQNRENNIPNREIKGGFGVGKFTVPRVEIDQTICLPLNRNFYVFQSPELEVYSDKSLSKLVESENVAMMSTSTDKTKAGGNLGTKVRHLDGRYHTLVKLPLITSAEAQEMPAGVPYSKNEITVITPKETKTAPKETPVIWDGKHKVGLHEVKPGETVWGIAQKYGMCNEQISNINPQLNCENPNTDFSCDTITPGQDIIVWTDNKK